MTANMQTVIPFVLCRISNTCLLFSAVVLYYKRHYINLSLWLCDCDCDINDSEWPQRELVHLYFITHVSGETSCIIYERIRARSDFSFTSKWHKPTQCCQSQELWELLQQFYAVFAFYVATPIRCNKKPKSYLMTCSMIQRVSEQGTSWLQQQHRRLNIAL